MTYFVLMNAMYFVWYNQDLWMADPGMQKVVDIKWNFEWEHLPLSNTFVFPLEEEKKKLNTFMY